MTGLVALGLLAFFLYVAAICAGIAKEISKATESLSLKDRRAKKELAKTQTKLAEAQIKLDDTNRRSAAAADQLRTHCRELELQHFQALQECPKCGTMGVHYIEDLWLGHDHRNLIRRCYNCNHGWYQS